MKHITISVFAISALFISNVYAYSPFGAKSPSNPYSEYGSKYGSKSVNNPYSEGVGPAYDR